MIAIVRSLADVHTQGSNSNSTQVDGGLRCGVSASFASSDRGFGDDSFNELTRPHLIHAVPMF
jgi:hypothetical protein